MGSLFPNEGLYSVLTGTDIYTVFGDVLMTTLQGISYSITRQKAPVYTMGSADFRGVARSKRGIAGSIILTTFDRHALYDFMSTSEFAAKKGSLETTSTNPYKAAIGTSPATLQRSLQTMSPAEISASVQVSALSAVTSIQDKMSEKATPMYADQLMPFDVTMMGANEYNAGAQMRAFGIELLNEGSGVSVDDTSNEVQMTYIARALSGWVPQFSAR